MNRPPPSFVRTPQPPARPSEADAEAAPRAQQRLLIVDDEPRLRDSLARLLGAQGLATVLASSGREAVVRLEQEPFDLVLLDLRLPDLSGQAVLAHIRRQGIDTGVIVVSAETDIDAAISVLKHGADDFVRKPFAFADLLKSIHNTLHRRLLQADNRRIAARLAHSERLYRHLVNSSPDVIYTLDPQGRFSFVNDRLERLLGLRREALIGQHYAQIVHEDDLERARHVFTERRSGERAARNVELRLRTFHAGPDGGHGTAATLLFNSIGLYEPLGEPTPSDIDADPAATAVRPDEAGAVYCGTYGVARDITERKRAEETISYQAYHDILTDLPNRILFRDRLEVAMRQATRAGVELAVMFIDLDRFKLVNDTLGHMRGDDLLKQAAARLKESLRRGDTLARLGGDEFIVMLPRMLQRDEASVVARKCLECLQLPFTLGDQEVQISASIGIAVYPGDGETIDELLAHADIAMYRIKAEGKNGHCFFLPAMLDATQQKLSIGKGLRQALELGELEVHYQPQVDVRSGRIVGAEGLLRWRHPHRGLLAAGEFLPHAEDAGLTVPISDWVLQTVCRDLAQWRADGVLEVSLALNLSPEYLERSDIVQTLRQAQAQWQIPLDRVEVEITENIGIRQPGLVVERLQALCRLGVSVAIDDFGTGYSSLAYLHRFPVHTIKIDQSFVGEIDHVNGHCPVVLAIIAMAGGLGMNLVAEGVETPEQAQYLARAGCHRMQGYLFFRPMPQREFLQRLREQLSGYSPSLIPVRQVDSPQAQLAFR